MLFIFITVLLDIIGIGIVIPITPQLVSQFVGGDLSDASRYYGPAIALYTAMQFLCAPTLGALSDRFGRKPILLLSLVGTSLAYLMTAFAPNLAWLYAARMLGGVAGASMTVASAYIADVSAPERRAQNFGMLGAAFGIGFIIGPALGGALGHFSLHLPFFVSAAVSLINFVYGLVALPESHRLENRRAFTWAKANPLSFVPLLRKYPQIMGMATSLLLVGLAQQCQQSNWVLFTSLRFKWSPAESGVSLALAGLCMVLVQGGLIRLVLPKLGERRAILYGLVLFGGSMVLFGLASKGWMMYAVTVVSSLSAIAGPATQGLISRQIGPDEQGAVQGALTSLTSLTGIVGPVVANQLFATFTAASAPVKIPGIAFFLGALLIGLAFLNMLRVFAKHPVPATAAQPAQV
ncbi:TCR/Tet family MFS transporter [bacterium]|nr:TCR/Tet family MFS transporter [bacterium]